MIPMRVVYGEEKGDVVRHEKPKRIRITEKRTGLPKCIRINKLTVLVSDTFHGKPNTPTADVVIERHLG